MYHFYYFFTKHKAIFFIKYCLVKLANRLFLLRIILSIFIESGSWFIRQSVVIVTKFALILFQELKNGEMKQGVVK